MNRLLSVPKHSRALPFSLSYIAKSCLNRRVLTPALLLMCGSASMNVNANCASYNETLECFLDASSIGNVSISLDSVERYSRLAIYNDSPVATYNIRDVRITNATTAGVWDDEEMYDSEYIDNEPVILVQSLGNSSVILHNLHVDLDKERINNVLIGIYGHDRDFDATTQLFVNNSNINTYSDTVFSFSEFYYDDEDQTADKILNHNLLNINNSSIINNKKHTFTNIVGYDDDYEYQLEHFLGGIFYFNHEEGMVYVESDNVEHVNINFNVNDSYLKAETLINLASGPGCCSDEDEATQLYRLTLNNSEGEFNNLINHIGDLVEAWEDDMFRPDENIEINLTNGSTVTSGIYSHAHGSISMENTSLNLSNGSIFNYLGGCVTECSLYDYGEYLTEPEESYFTPTKHFYDSYIHSMSINSGSSLVFADTGSFKTLYVDQLNGDGTGTIVLNTRVEDAIGDRLRIDTATGKFNVAIRDSGSEPADTSVGLALIHVMHGEADQFSLNNGLGVDIGAYTYDLAYVRNDDEYHWYLGYVPDELDENGNNSGGDGSPNENGNGGTKTSPGTDGIVSIASAAQFILNDELTNFRKRRGEMHVNNAGNANAWGRFIGNRMEMDGPASSSYKLQRHGMEFGFDWNTDLNNERLIYGVSTSYSDNRVKHARGGKSGIDAYTLGVYATLLKSNHVYLDGVMKYVHFDNDVKIRTTNGSQLDGKYKQNGFAGAFELGYKHTQGEPGNAIFIEPYARFSYANVAGKDITLNGGLQADIKTQHSAIGEIGASAGKAFTLENGAIVAPYVKLAVQHEFVDRNDVYINKKHKFNNDFSGTRGNYGAGVNLAISDNTNLYAEINYMSGHNVESPINGNVGFRFNF